MKVTKVYFNKFEKDGLVGFSSVTLDDALVIKNISVRAGNDGGYFISFPSKKRNAPYTNPKTGKEELYEDQVFCIEKELRKNITDAILAEAGLDLENPF